VISRVRAHKTYANSAAGTAICTLIDRGPAAEGSPGFTV
jgi:hypothetical protein